jgi:hypothetical protein
MTGADGLTMRPTSDIEVGRVVVQRYPPARLIVFIDYIENYHRLD